MAPIINEPLNAAEPPPPPPAPAEAPLPSSPNSSRTSKSAETAVIPPPAPPAPPAPPRPLIIIPAPPKPAPSPSPPAAAAPPPPLGGFAPPPRSSSLSIWCTQASMRVASGPPFTSAIDWNNPSSSHKSSMMSQITSDFGAETIQGFCFINLNILSTGNCTTPLPSKSMGFSIFQTLRTSSGYKSRKTSRSSLVNLPR